MISMNDDLVQLSGSPERRGAFTLCIMEPLRGVP